jgi:hypothetical protein
MRVIYVKRGEFSTFSVLSDSCQTLPNVDVRWDRRCGADRRRRTNSINDDRRRNHRRKPPTPVAELQGYTVVELTGKDASASE